ERHRHRATHELPLAAGLIPVLEGPGLQSQLPWRQVLKPPLCKARRRPVAEPPFLFDIGRYDHALDDTAITLSRRVTDCIDEFGLVGHGRSLRPKSAPASLRRGCQGLSTLTKNGDTDVPSVLLQPRQRNVSVATRGGVQIFSRR